MPQSDLSSSHSGQKVLLSRVTAYPAHITGGLLVVGTLMVTHILVSTIPQNEAGAVKSSQCSALREIEAFVVTVFCQVCFSYLPKDRTSLGTLVTLSSPPPKKNQCRFAQVARYLLLSLKLTPQICYIVEALNFWSFQVGWDCECMQWSVLCGAGDRTWGFLQAWQPLYKPSYTTNLFIIFFI